MDLASHLMRYSGHFGWWFTEEHSGPTQGSSKMVAPGCLWGKIFSQTGHYRHYPYDHTARLRIYHELLVASLEKARRTQKMPRIPRLCRVFNRGRRGIFCVLCSWSHLHIELLQKLWIITVVSEMQAQHKFAAHHNSSCNMCIVHTYFWKLNS